MISIIVAIDEKNGIGKDNNLLAHIKPDLQYFKNITMDHTIIMGYHTYTSLPIRPLPNRNNIIITRKQITMEGVMVLHSIEEALKWIKQSKEKEVFICGGATIYEQFIPYADRLYITHIFHDFSAEVFFPSISNEWKIISTQANRENLEHKYPHLFTVYEK